VKSTSILSVEVYTSKSTYYVGETISVTIYVSHDVHSSNLSLHGPSDYSIDIGMIRAGFHQIDIRQADPRDIGSWEIEFVACTRRTEPPPTPSPINTKSSILYTLESIDCNSAVTDFEVIMHEFPLIKADIELDRNKIIIEEKVGIEIAIRNLTNRTAYDLQVKIAYSSETLTIIEGLTFFKYQSLPPFSSKSQHLEFRAKEPGKGTIEAEINYKDELDNHFNINASERIDIESSPKASILWINEWEEDDFRNVITKIIAEEARVISARALVEIHTNKEIEEIQFQYDGQTETWGETEDLVFCDNCFLVKVRSNEKWDRGIFKPIIHAVIGEIINSSVLFMDSTSHLKMSYPTFKETYTPVPAKLIGIKIVFRDGSQHYISKKDLKETPKELKGYIPQFSDAFDKKLGTWTDNIKAEGLSAIIDLIISLQDFGTIVTTSYPGDLLVIDSNDNQVGALYENGEFSKAVTEVEGGIYLGTDTQSIVYLPQETGNLIIKIFGKNKGNYTLTIISEEKIQNTSANIGKGEVHEYLSETSETGEIGLSKVKFIEKYGSYVVVTAVLALIIIGVFIRQNRIGNLIVC
jgi:hypothetical protein